MRKLAAISLFALFISACAFNPPPRFEPSRYPQVHQAFDLTFYWNIDRSKDLLTLNGFLRNRIHPKIRDIEVSAILIGPTGEKIGKEVTDFVLEDVAMDDYAYFTLPLPLKDMSPPAGVRIYYRYNLVERESGVLPQFHSFDITL